MRAPTQNRFLIEYHSNGNTQVPLKKYWNGKDLVSLGHPIRYILQNKDGKILMRDLADMHPQFQPLATETHIIIHKLKAIAPMDLGATQKITPSWIPTSDLPDSADRLYQQYLKRGMGLAVLLTLLILGLNLTEQKDSPNEALIPKKYAKLIFAKPKINSQANSSESSTSQANTKGITRVFQSKTVQQDIKSILQGGLSKYSINTHGKSIQKLSIKLKQEIDGLSAHLQTQAAEMLAADQKGNLQRGISSSDLSGAGTQIKGQGLGQQVEIGLNSDAITLDEGLTKDEVARVIHHHLSEVRYCYETALLKDSSLAGKALIAFTVNPSGRVNSGNIIENTLADVSVGNCLIDKLKSWKFPVPRGGVSVSISYPFHFKSTGR